MPNETKIIEIRVETTGDADIKRLSKALADLAKQQNATLKSTRELNAGMQSVAGNLKHAFALLGTGFTIKGLIGASDEMRQLNDQVKTIADTFISATFEASGFMDALNDQESWNAINSFVDRLGTYLGNVIGFLGQGASLWGEWSTKLDPVAKGLKWIGEHWAKEDAEKAAAAQRHLLAISRGEGTPLLEGPTVTASVSQGAREDRAAEEQRAKELAAAAESARTMQKHLAESVTNQQALLEAAQQSNAAYEAMKDAQADAAELAKLRAQYEKAHLPDLEKRVALARDEIALRRELQNETQFQLDMNDALKELQDETYKNANDQAERNADQVNEALDNQNEFFKNNAQGMEELQAAAGVLAHAFTSIFSGGIRNARDFFRVILEGLAEVAAQQAILGILGNVGSKDNAASGVLGFLGGLFTKHAQGSAFHHGAVVPFAAGGVVTRPTIFPMARGVGLMGEAGPEAVMPLKRTAGGRLGVSVTGGAVTVVNNLGTPAIARTNRRDDRLEIVLEAAQMGSQLAVAEINRSVSSGYGITAQTMSRSYGLRRRL